MPSTRANCTVQNKATIQHLKYLKSMTTVKQCCRRHQQRVRRTKTYATTTAPPLCNSHLSPLAAVGTENKHLSSSNETRERRNESNTNARRKNRRNQTRGNEQSSEVTTANDIDGRTDGHRSSIIDHRSSNVER